MKIIQEVQIAKKKDSGERHIPKIIAWKGIKMIRIHSFRASINEILEVSKELDVVKVGIIGNQHTGKTTMALCIAHLIHKMSMKDGGIPYAIRYFDKESLLNLKKTIESLSPANYVMIFDDVSFMGATASKHQIEGIKQIMTEIRHMEGGRDIKVIIIMNYHYTLGLDKYLRQADFRYFTSVGSSELENMEKIVGHKYVRRLTEFQQMYSKALVKKHFFFRIGPKEVFSYKYRSPFIPALFFNNDTLRYVVSPTKEWIDPICSICSDDKISQVDILQFIKETKLKYGEGSLIAAVKLKLYLNGLHTYSPQVERTNRYLDKALDTKIIKLEDLAAALELTITKVRVRKKLDGVLA